MEWTLEALDRPVVLLDDVVEVLRLDGPAINGRVIDLHAVLCHHLFDVPQAQRVGGVPAHTDQHHLQQSMHTLEHFA
jgi:hypothetical protein